MKLSKNEIQCLAMLDRYNIPAYSCYVDKKFITFFVPRKYYKFTILKKKTPLLKKKFSKNIEFFPFAKDIKKCLQLSLKSFGIKQSEIKIKDDYAYIKLGAEDKSKIMRNISKFKRFKELLKNTFEIKNIKV